MNKKRIGCSNILTNVVWISEYFVPPWRIAGNHCITMAAASLHQRPGLSTRGSTHVTSLLHQGGGKGGGGGFHTLTHTPHTPPPHMLTQHYRLSPTVALRNTTPFRNSIVHVNVCMYVYLGPLTCTIGYGGCRRVPQSIPTCGTSRAVVSCYTRHLTTLHNTEHTNLRDVPCSSILLYQTPNYST